jgi:diguanylate cyclase (GGDEF)-like protein/PAS domain S-box-containing protein
MVQTVAVCLRGEIKENFRYRLHGTPSQATLDDGLCFHERGVSRRFPADGVLQDLAVESYFGISLLDYSGRPMGVVTVMGCAAMKSRQPAQAILQIYAARVAAELQHKKSHAQILDLVKFPDETPSPVLRIRYDGVMLYANQGSLAVVTAWNCWPGGRVPADIHRLCLAALERRAVSEVDLTCGDKIFSFLLAPSSESGYVSFYGRDITERLRADAQMRKLSSALEQAADSVMITDVGGRIEYVNPAFSAMTGYSHDEAIGRRPDIVKSDRHDAEFFRDLWDTLNAGRVFQNIFVNRKKDGTLYFEEKTITPLKDAAGAVTHFISNGKDITERMQAEERLHRLAYHDVLTGLPNRALFMERLLHALSRKGRNRQLAVMFLDMDQFKTINDTLGHDVGDQLLQAFPERIAGCIRQSDTIARFGGDEFAILLEDIAAAEAVGQIAAKIIERLAQPFAVGTHELFVTISIGISLYPDDSSDVYTLLKHADSAMYRAKELGRNTYQFYSQEMSTKAYERLSLETSLRYALSRGEFELYYQPQVDLASGRVIGAEALIRWIHPEMGIVSPEKFIPLLEETGMIVPVGTWVLRSACEHLREWQGYSAQPLRMSVNLSGRQFHDLGFKDQIAAIVQRTGVDPALLELEITESVLMQNDKVPMQNLHALLGLGLRFAIDDFGTGYSSLSYLKRFPVHTIKIDRSFVRDVTVNSDDATIVNTIILMAHSLKLTVVAEGVETPEQLAFLRRCGCDLMQGYLFSHPLTATEMERLLIDGRGLELTTAA